MQDMQLIGNGIRAALNKYIYTGSVAINEHPFGIKSDNIVFTCIGGLCGKKNTFTFVRK